MQIVKEGLKAGDLEDVGSNRFSIDQYKSKMGEDKNIMVLAFTVDGKAPAMDLERFAETGCPAVMDADATPGTMEDGKHRVFVEFARKEGVIRNIINFLEDLKKLINEHSNRRSKCNGESRKQGFKSFNKRFWRSRKITGI